MSVWLNPYKELYAYIFFKGQLTQKTSLFLMNPYPDRISLTAVTVYVLDSFLPLASQHFL